MGGASARSTESGPPMQPPGRTPCGWRECPPVPARSAPGTHASHPMWVARVPVQMHVSRRASVPLSHPMWVARVPVVNSFFVAIKNASSHPMWVARVPVARSNKFCGVRSLSHPMWVARVPVSRQRQYNTSLYRRTPCGWRECPFRLTRKTSKALKVAPHVGGASARLLLQGVMSISNCRTPCGWRECPLTEGRQYAAPLSSHPMWVARVPVSTPRGRRLMRTVAPHVGGASARHGGQS